jgi:error-prone DNA polymerase
MLTCIRKAFALLKEHEGLDLGLADVPKDDAATYDMLCRGDSIGVFQVESRAQINMLPRLRPRVFYDLVIQVAIVRPGPIQGDMVHPYLRRRSGLEPAAYPSPAPPHDPDELVAILGKTKGVPLFQEQAMQLAMVAAEFSDVEANQLRRAMATFRNIGTIGRFEALMVERMVRRGYDPVFARNCFEQIKGFGSYGFPESHAASFAKLVYISSWIKRHHPAAFACALLNAQPMGFYAPAQIVRDASEHGVEIRPVDVHRSDWDHLLERDEAGRPALRLGFRQAEGIREDEARRLVERRGAGFPSVEALARRTELPARAMRALADADAFRSLGLDRRAALWEVRRLPDDDPLPLFAAAEARELGEEAEAHLPALSLGEHVATDYQTLRLSLKVHPLSVLRPRLAAERVTTAAEAVLRGDGRFVKTGGLVLVRQRPGRGNAIFITLEDETGIVNVLLWARQLEAFRREVMAARLMLVEGRVQRSPEGIVHIMASRIIDRTALLGHLWDAPPPGLAPGSLTPLAPADEGATLSPAFGAGQEGHQAPLSQGEAPNHDPPRHSHPRNARLLPKSRDFH